MKDAVKPPLVTEPSDVNLTFIARLAPYTTVAELRYPDSSRICVAAEQSSVAQSNTLTTSYPFSVLKLENVIWATRDALLTTKIHSQKALLG